MAAQPGLADQMEEMRGELSELVQAGCAFAALGSLRQLAQLLDNNWSDIIAAVRAAAPSEPPIGTDCPFDARLPRTPYLVMPKLALQAMPMAWRLKFDAMLGEMEALGIDTPGYIVFRDDGPGERFTRATVVNEDTGFVRVVKGEADPWADYRHNQVEKVAALCPRFNERQPIRLVEDDEMGAAIDG